MQLLIEQFLLEILKLQFKGPRLKIYILVGLQLQVGVIQMAIQEQQLNFKGQYLVRVAGEQWFFWFLEFFFGEKMTEFNGEIESKRVKNNGFRLIKEPLMFLAVFPMKVARISLFSAAVNASNYWDFYESI
ncbi:uncharacterized protein LOC111386143 [Olea europaea var. sylvestris]|uniref:uncharacterized protein LOC111386143 n=1 Tax=Olea europaea var. sylvestris TaxID=158386 RepID=UPI000C1D128B|nr:uncharacterized protein LOC111386143 [Olea europaea var. sylvestris]